MNFSVKNLLITALLCNFCGVTQAMKRGGSREEVILLKRLRSGNQHGSRQLLANIATSFNSSIQKHSAPEMQYIMPHTIEIPSNAGEFQKPVLLKDRDGCCEGVAWTIVKDGKKVVCCSVEDGVGIMNNVSLYIINTAIHPKGYGKEIMANLMKQAAKSDSTLSTQVEKPKIERIYFRNIKQIAEEQEMYRQSLFSAVKQGQELAVSNVLEKYPSLINKQDSNGDTVLSLAVKDKRVKMVNLLIKNGAQSVKNYDNESPLMWMVNDVLTDDKDMAASMEVIIALAQQSSLRMVEQVCKQAQLVSSDVNLNRVQRKHKQSVTASLMELKEKKNIDRKRKNQYEYALEFGNALKRRKIVSQ